MNCSSSRRNGSRCSGTQRRNSPRCWRCDRTKRRLRNRYTSRRNSWLRCCRHWCRRGWRRCGSRGSRSYHWLSHRLGLCGGDLGLLLRLGRRFGVCLRAKVFADPFRLVVLKRARMGLLLGNPDLRQVLDQELCLDLEFPREFVDTNLTSVRHSLCTALRFGV